MTEENRQQVENGLATAMGLNDLEGQMTQDIIINNATNNLLSLNFIPLANTYKSNGFAKLAVDLPVSDCFRDGGFELDSATLNSDELKELQETIEEKDVEIIKQCLRWGRLYGGGVILCNTNQKADTPFNPETIYKKPVEFLACDRWQCYPLATSLYLAEQFLLQDNMMGEKGNNVIFDASRVKTFAGEVQPYYIRNQLQGWGASIFESIIPQLNQYIKANSVILELLDEAKIDILKIFDMASLLGSAEGERLVKRRAELFALQKSYKNMGVMDSQDDYIQKTMTFAGLNEMLEKIFLLICSSLRIPYSKVFGRGASGFSSGEDDLENYNAMIMSELRVPVQPIIKWIANIRCYQLFGRKVDDLTINWKPLRVMTEKEKQEIDSGKISSYMQLLQARVMTPKQVAEKLNQEEIIAFSEEELNEIDDSFENIDDELMKQEDITVNNSLWQKALGKLKWN